MKINVIVLQKWTELRSENDTQRIAEIAEVTPQTIRNAFNEGKCSDEVFEAMANYYKEKDELIKSYL